MYVAVFTISLALPYLTYACVWHMLECFMSLPHALIKLFL